MTGFVDGRRYAIYFAPSPESALYRFGSAWLGRDGFSGAEFDFPLLDGLPLERWRRVTTSPRLYGFHATLKPPFHLSPDASADELVGDIERFANAHESLEAPPLRLARIAHFLALVPQASSPALSALADACVCDFDRFRAQPSADELARRERAGLTSRQRELLAQWGYPYVLDQWRFHMTLASGLDREEADELCRMLEPLASPYTAAPLVVDAICLFEQPAPQASFRAVRHFPLRRRSGE